MPVFRTLLELHDVVSTCRAHQGVSQIVAELEASLFFPQNRRVRFGEGERWRRE
jgi:hypothetical protein